MSKKSKLAKNTVSSLLFQITMVICGFILPRLLLTHFGSDVNGLVNSITQFLSIISFLDLGVGAVFQSSLYKPLANHDNGELSKIFKSGQKFFTRLAQILLLYVAVLVIIYPFFVKDKFDFLYTASLIVVMSISSFAQYYFGMSNGLLLTADQKGYIQYNVQTITLLINTIFSFILIQLGASIHFVKLSTSLIYIARPIFLKTYVDKYYEIDHKVVLSEEPIKQKWNGLSQHISFVVLESTDTVVLTLFSSLQDVSIYSVYFLVISGLKQLLNVTTNGIQALIGELYAEHDESELTKVFGWTEWVIHTVTTLLFGCASVLIIPFVLTYTRGINDANYNQPLFSILIILAYAMYCIRLPYHIVIKAAVHYKETERCYLIAAIINIVLSIAFVKFWGLIGVAIGTLVAMTYQTVWMAKYDSAHIVFWPFKRFIKQILIDSGTFLAGMLITSQIRIVDYTYQMWVLLAVIVLIIWLLIIIAVNSIFYQSYMRRIFAGFVRRLRGNHEIR